MKRTRWVLTLFTGFSRTDLRAKTVRTIIRERAITEHFHTEVAQLTAKVALLLQPLTHFLYSRPPFDGGSNRTIDDQYQALHNIIALAAYLSICIRLSPTIFYFSSVRPNAEYDPDDQHCVEPEVYIKSKDTVVQEYLDDAIDHQKKTEELQKEINSLNARGKGPNSRAGKKAKAKLDAHTWSRKPLERTHAALTKIAVWPSIKRFKPGTQEDDYAAVPLEHRKGFRIFDISKSAVVSYYGVDDDVERSKGRTKLADFVEKKVKMHGKKELELSSGVPFIMKVTAAVAAAWIILAV